MTGESEPLKLPPPGASATIATDARTDHTAWGWESLHLVGLSALVFAQPLFAQLQNNPGYIAQEGLGPTDLYIITALLLLGPPLLMFLLEGLARLRGVNARRQVHLALMGGLWVLLGVSWLNEPLRGLRSHGVPAGWLTLLVALVGGWWVTRQYARARWVGYVLTIAAVSLVVLPVQFLTSPRIAAICFAPEVLANGPRARRPVPVVMIVFDALSGMALLNERHEIDAVRYPNFARLARTSTYYRNMTTVHHRTDNAVPALLSGRLPSGKSVPFISEYPVNLFTLLKDSGQYELTIFEPYTRLCPSELRYVSLPRSPFDRITRALSTLVTVYRWSELPRDLPFRPDAAPRSWLRMPNEEQFGMEAREGLMIYAWDSRRHLQIEHFLECLQPSRRPALRFLHVVVPHDPWIYLPSGRRYVPSSTAGESPIGTHGPLGEQWGPDPLEARTGWQRYLLQVQYVDRVLGQILDRLSAAGLLDASLVVVTADHGLAFTPGESRRDPIPQTFPAILPVPLFVKLPGQRQGVISDRNVESIDVLPTIVDAIGLETSAPFDGASLLDPREAPRPRKTLVARGGNLSLDPDFPEKFQYVEEAVRTFGSGTSEDRLMRPALHPEWLGKKVVEFRIGPDSPARTSRYRGGDRVDPRRPDVVPCFHAGMIVNPDEVSLPLEVVVEVNGEIAGITRTFNDPKARSTWAVVIDEHRFHSGKNTVRYFEAVSTADGVELRPMRLNQFGN